MGMTRKYGLILVLLISLGIIMNLPNWLLYLIPSFTDNPLDFIVIIYSVLIIIIFLKG